MLYAELLKPVRLDRLSEVRLCRFKLSFMTYSYRITGRLSIPWMLLTLLPQTVAFSLWCSMSRRAVSNAPAGQATRTTTLETVATSLVLIG